MASFGSWKTYASMSLLLLGSSIAAATPFAAPEYAGEEVLMPRSQDIYGDVLIHPRDLELIEEILVRRERLLRRDTTQGSTSASLTSSSGKTATANSVSTKDNGAGTQTTKITQDGAKPGSAAPPGVLSVQKGAAKAPGAPGAKPGAKVVDGKKAVEHKHKPKAAAGQPQLGAPQPPPPASGQGFFGGSNVPPGMNALCASMPGMC